MPKIKTHKPALYRRKSTLWFVGILIFLIVATLLAFKLSPWPGALIIRSVFNDGGRKTLAALEQQVPPLPVKVISNQHYSKNSDDALLDVYIPEAAAGSDQKLPVVVWTHGGAWLSGNKSDAAPYFRLLANRGFVVVAPNYSLAPGKTYPTQIHQLNEVHKYIQANTERFHADINKVVLAGDSAGAQLSSQMATLITQPSYAAEVGLKPALSPAQLAGVVLFCGIYRMEGLTHPSSPLPKIITWGDDVTVWAYTGSRDKSGSLIRQISAFYNVNENFPPTFISGGNADPLTNAQSKPFAAKLNQLNVDVTTLFYESNHQPGLPHEYQFTLNTDGKNAFEQMIQFVSAKTR